jgi:acyl transferase domain-containing protein
MGMYKILHKAGLRPHFAAGHSFGELTALWAAEVYDDATFMALAKMRGEAMATVAPGADTGAMLAVKADEATVRQLISQTAGLSIANVNSPDQIVIGGSTAAVQAAENSFRAAGYSVVRLPVAAAFHTEYVRHAQVPLARFMHTQRFNRPAFPRVRQYDGTALSCECRRTTRHPGGPDPAARTVQTANRQYVRGRGPHLH